MITLDSSVMPLSLTDDDFRILSTYTENVTGIKMPESKRILMQSRLMTRLKKLRFTTFAEYIAFVFSGAPGASTELISMTDALTTNLTEFFREPSHFEYLTEVILPEFASNKFFNIWSAGCSTGQEPYTMCIVLSEFMLKNPGSYQNFSVLASDLSTRVLQTASEAVYPAAAVEKIPFAIKQRYFTKSKDPSLELVRVKPSLRSHVTFRHLNFMDNDFKVSEKMQVIFCRNVLIYFDKKNQESIIRKLLKCLIPGGYLILGHSETIMGMNLPFKTVSPTVFKKIKEGA